MTLNHLLFLADVADLGHDLDGDQGRARGGAAGLLRRRALHPGVGGAAGRGARVAGAADRRPRRARDPQRRAGQCRHLRAALLGHAVRRLRRRRRGQHVDDLGVPVRLRHPVRPGARELAPSGGTRPRHCGPGDPVLRQGELLRRRHRAVGRGRDRRRLGLLCARLGAVASAARAGDAAATDRRAGRWWRRSP